MTTEEKYSYKKYKLNVNPNPKDNRTSFIKSNVRTTQSKYMSFPDNMKDWSFDKYDMPIVRHLKKDYKKKHKKHKKRSELWITHSVKQDR